MTRQSTAEAMTSAPLAPVAASIGAARRCVQEFLVATPARALAVEAGLVTTELAANAARQSAAPFTVAASVEADCVRIAVSDDSAEAPELSAAAPSCAAAWGVERSAAGKTVWVAIPRSAARCRTPRRRRRA
ncbi:MAG: hypothetical protein ACKVWR_07395 [Acidimicrobiales bacterium]